jgi:hypothetical protein
LLPESKHEEEKVRVEEPIPRGAVKVELGDTEQGGTVLYFLYAWMRDVSHACQLCVCVL